MPFRLQIGYSFDYGGLINNRSLLENLTLPLLYHKTLEFNEARDRAMAVLKMFDIQKFAGERPAHVPGRVRKIICLLRPLMMRPQMLLMDDPSVGIGQDSTYVLVDLIHDLRKQGFLSHIFMSSYDEKFVNLFDHHILHLNEGQLYYQPVENEKKVVHL